MRKYLLGVLALVVAVTVAAASPLSAQEPLPDPLMDPANNIIHPATHSDVSVRLDYNGKPLHFGMHETFGSTDRWHEFANTFVAVPNSAIVTMPAPGFQADYTFITGQGGTFYRIPKGQASNMIWLGISAESLPGTSTLRTLIQRQLVLRLDGVSGIDGGPPPGDFFLAASETGMGNGGSPLLSTRQGLPQAFEWLARGFGHVHVTWDFTAPGIYCLNFNVNGRLANGTRIDDQQVMTVLVGDANIPADPTTLQTCAQRGVFPIGIPGSSAEPQAASGNKTIIGPTGVGVEAKSFADLTPRIVGGDLQIGVVQGSQTSTGTLHDPANVVFVRNPLNTSTNPTGSSPAWLASTGQHWRSLNSSACCVTAGVKLGWDLTRVSASDGLQADITWHLRGVYGPNGAESEFVLYNRTSTALTEQAVLSNRSGYEVSTYALWPGTASREDDGSPVWTFKVPTGTGAGRYCADMEWTAVINGQTKSVRKSLTFAFGVANPANVELCTWQTPDPDPDPTPTPTPDPDPDPTPTPTPVPGEGRVVLDVGHVDVQGVIEGESIDLIVKDDRDSPAVYFGPEEVTFYASPDSAYTVVSPAEDFLGEVGATVWVLPENPTDGLLWPGWNVDPDGTPVRWTLDSVRGPGEFALYFTAGLPPTPNVLMYSGDGLPDSFDYNQHGHGAWAFTAQGVYCLDLTIETLTAVGGSPTGPNDSGTLLFAVGDIDPAGVTEADCDSSQGSGTTQTIQVDLLQDGGLTLSVAGDQVFMGQAQLNSVGNALVSSGALNTVSVVDMRLQTVQWNANGSISEFFVSGEDQFSGDALGWEPRVLVSSCLEDVTPGGLVSPGVGLHSALLGQGVCRGTTELDALLELEIAVDTPPGEYSAVLTLTLI